MFCLLALQVLTMSKTLIGKLFCSVFNLKFSTIVLPEDDLETCQNMQILK
jgi:3-hydroxymyristoyl/3-hydroxydecanoyl-(acyl carrier protein) dehydratase